MKINLRPTIQNKLIVGFAFVTFILVAVGIVGLNGAVRLKNYIKQTGEVSMPASQAILNLNQSLTEIKASSRTLLNPSLTPENRQVEYQKIENAFTHADEEMASYQALIANEEWNTFIENWKTLKGNVRSFLELARKIDSIQIQNPQKVAMEVERQFGKYRSWAAETVKAVLEQIQFKGNLDPEKSDFWIWLSSQEVRNEEVQVAANRLKQQITQVFDAVRNINDFLSIEEYDLAKDVYTAEVLPSIDSMQFYVDALMIPIVQALDYFNQMTNHERNLCAKSMEETELTLNSLVSDTNTQARHNVAQGNSISSKVTMLVLAAILLGVLVALTFGFFISRSITLPIKMAIKVIGNISQGDTSSNMDVGETFNCSSIKKCGISDCPSYGKIDPCWVNSGSFSAVKYCPRAQKGEDCRSCEVYGDRTEMEELGSIIMALSNTIQEREQLALAISQGDLVKKVAIASDKDNLGKSLMIMQESLKIIGQVQSIGMQIANESTHVSTSSQNLSQCTMQQASSLEEITNSMVQMGSQTDQNAENASQANQLAAEVRQAAEKGTIQMDSMIGAMGDINNAAQNISKIIKVIDEIAFQTNLLALNAAVEAARAGRHGKGFAVVAEEVRNLAARSAKAAKETENLIEGSLLKTENGMDIANTTAAALGEMVNGITSVSDLVAKIATSSNEQAQGISQVNLGLKQIENITQKNTNSAGESAEASVVLSTQAEQLRKLLAHFRLSEYETKDMPYQETALSPLQIDGGENSVHKKGYSVGKSLEEGSIKAIT